MHEQNDTVSGSAQKPPPRPGVTVPIWTGAVIELAILDDHNSLETSSSNNNETSDPKVLAQTEIFVMQVVVNGLSSLMPSLGIKLRLVYLRIMYLSESSALHAEAAAVASAKGHTNITRELSTPVSFFFERSVYATGDMKGRADAILFLTQDRSRVMTTGMAVTGGVCSPDHQTVTLMVPSKQSGYDSVHYKETFPETLAMIAAHNLGHLLGLTQADDCSDCVTRSGNCIMHSVSSFCNSPWSSSLQRMTQMLEQRSSDAGRSPALAPDARSRRGNRS